MRAKSHLTISHRHSHGAIDPSFFTTQRGIWAVKVSFLGLLATTVFQAIVVLFSGSIALLADTIHNLGDAATAIPLWIAFRLATWKPTQRFTYGYGRVEDLAGIVIVVIILFSAFFAGYESIDRLYRPQEVGHIGAVIVASIVGFLGNEIVAVFRIRVGKEIGSIALVADGYHARIDGFSSLAVFFGAVGVWMGYPLSDPFVGLVISAAILRIAWNSGKLVFTRLLDGISPEVIDDVKGIACATKGVKDVTQVRVRWLGHRIVAEINIAVNPEISVESGHRIAMDVEHRLLHSLRYLSSATIHVDPINASGEEHHLKEKQKGSTLHPHLQ
ncbi:MAG: cation diffusion facilitator family transporter [Thermodesulfobacteriota bacterium]|nr:cation diffusion facilitator family transporter [Thermodesulfobacteriota bacterium]